MIQRILSALCLIVILSACKNDPATTQDNNQEEEMAGYEKVTFESYNPMPNFKLTAISHASTVLEWNGKVVFVDPVGDYRDYNGFGEPDYILVTDIHGDHLDNNTINKLRADKTIIIAPAAVQKKFDKPNLVTVLNNGEITTLDIMKIEAIPMYNLTEGRLKYHEKGRGNGYVIESDSYRVYFSGDTEDIKEMRGLENIDLALVTMNLPYTMTMEQAMGAVVEFSPKMVIPYHYRGTEGYEDFKKFAELVPHKNPAVNVHLLNWYPRE